MEGELLPLVSEKNHFLQIDTINLLKDIGTKQSVPTLQTLTADNNPFVRRAAQDAVTVINRRTK